MYWTFVKEEIILYNSRMSQLLHLPTKLRNKVERKLKAKEQLQASFKSEKLKKEIIKELDRCGPDVGLIMNILSDAHLKVPRYGPVVPLKPVVAAPEMPVVPAAVPAPVPGPVMPIPAPAPIPAFVPAPVPVVRGTGTSEQDAIDVLDSEDEFIEALEPSNFDEMVVRVRAEVRRLRSQINPSQ